MNSKPNQDVILTILNSKEELQAIRDDYMGAFKPPAAGEPHSSGLGTNPVQGAQPTESKKGIVVKLGATYSGMYTRNNTMYMPDKMRAAVTTWTDIYKKPVLVHHDKGQDPVGRVLSAKYVDTTNSLVDKYKDSLLKKGIVADQAFWDDFSNSSISLKSKFKKIQLMDSILEDPHYKGMGYIELECNILDAEAIQKVLDGRYLTVSIGASSDAAVCSICGSDWMQDDMCDHTPGEKYAGKKCVLIAGDLEYNEVSFVNVPAARHAKVLQIENSLKSVGLFTDSAGGNVNVLDELLTKLFQDQELTDEEADQLYALQLEEMDKDILEDAKLSTEKRKDLPKTSFCGPGRSFPVPDCAHVTAARRLIGKYKGEGSKDKIMACVNRKAKAMDCPAQKDSVETNQDTAVLNTINELLDKHQDLVVKAVTEKGLVKIEDASTLRAELVKLEDLVAKQEEQIGELRDQAKEAKATATTALEDMAVLEDKIIKQTEKAKTAKVEKAKIYQTLLEDSLDLNSLSDEQLDSTILSFESKLDMKQIASKINDGMSRTPTGTTSLSDLTDKSNQNEIVSKPLAVSQEFVDEQYRLILNRVGYARAEQYYNDAVQQGLASKRK